MGDVIRSTQLTPESRHIACGMYLFGETKWGYVNFDPDALFLVVEVHDELEFPDELVMTLVSLENGTKFKFKSSSTTLALTCEVFCSGEYPL